MYTEHMSFPNYLKEYISQDKEIVPINNTIYGIAERVDEQKKDALNKERKLLVVTGLSGAGKDSVVQGLVSADKRFGWIKTCTTRSRRPEENDDNDPYVRLTEEMFQTALKNGDVIESVEYAGHHYCSLSSLFREAYNFCEIPILRIDPKGANFYTKMWRKNEGIFKDINLVSVFVVPPSIESLKERLLNRSGDPEFVKKRIEQTEIDIPFVGDAEYITINETGKLESVVGDIKKII